MSQRPKLITMLTNNDRTVENAYEVFEKCKNSKCLYFGIKETGLQKSEMKKLFSCIKKNGKTAVLEVVAYTEEECIKGANLAVECNCDILMGTLFFDSVNEICKNNNIKYMPFVGKIKNRPSVLEGEIPDIINEGKAYIKKGVYGIDILAYRYVNDPYTLIKEFTKNIECPLCIAGSINSFERLSEVKNTNAKFFTIGGAFFCNKFGEDFSEQIDTVIDFMEK